MAPHLEISSLTHLCLRALSSVIDRACLEVYLEHGCYGNEKCIKVRFIIFSRATAGLGSLLIHLDV